MHSSSPQSWFFSRLAKEAFLIYSVTWVVLFALEVAKDGIVSNYISLPHAAIPAFFLGVLWLATINPEAEKPSENESLPKVYLFILSIFVALFLWLIIDASIALTLLIIFATLAAIWSAALSFYHKE